MNDRPATSDQKGIFKKSDVKINFKTVTRFQTPQHNFQAESVMPRTLGVFEVRSQSNPRN